MNSVTAKEDEYERVQVPYVEPLASTTSTTAAAVSNPQHHHGATNHPLPTISTLPPIAMARPVGGHRTIHNTTNNNNTQGATSNIPVVNGVRQVLPPSNPQYAPTVVNLSAAAATAPSTVPAAHMLPELLPPPFFEYMDKCRYIGGFMLCYYTCTFFFLQPFFLGVLGIMTGFLGYYGARAPIYAGHIKWIRGYLWMNYCMVGMNVWYLMITVFYQSTVASFQQNHYGPENGENENTPYRYEDQHLGLFMGVVIALNMILHFSGIKSAAHFHAELLRAGPLAAAAAQGHRTVVVLSGQGHIV